MKKPSQAGFTLIEIMSALAIGAVVVVLASDLFVRTSQNQTRSADLAQLVLVRRAILEAIDSDPAWHDTVTSAKNSTSMACLNSLNPCVPHQPKELALYDAGGRLLIDSTDPARGLTANGVSCDQFSPSGNDLCPFRYELLWEAVCLPPNCIQPQVKITAKLLYAPAASKMAINTDRYSFYSYYRAPYAEQLCGSANGKTDLSAPPSGAQLCNRYVVTPATPSGPPWYWACGALGNGEMCNADGSAKCLATTKAGCQLPTLPLGQGGGACASSGACHYTCYTGGIWLEDSNNCGTCPAMTINGCTLPSLPSGSSGGSCPAPGACNYTCNNGTWIMNSNTCQGHWYLVGAHFWACAGGCKSWGTTCNGGSCPGRAAVNGALCSPIGKCCITPHQLSNGSHYGRRLTRWTDYYRCQF